MPKLLITGASGYLSQTLIPHAAQIADVVGVARDASKISDKAQALSLDICDRNAVLDVVRTVHPDAIIHCAACNPGCDASLMLPVNEWGSAHIAEAADIVGSRLVAVSSDTVLNGVDAPFRDDVVADPLPDNAYAVSKARGEVAIQQRMPSAVIVRTSLIYGIAHRDRGTSGFIDRLNASESLKLFTDVIRQPVYDQALSQSLCTLALKSVSECGVINVAGSEALSRYEFGIRMLDYWNIEYRDQLIAVSGKTVAGLPLDLRLSLDRARDLGLPTPGVSEVLSSHKG